MEVCPQHRPIHVLCRMKHVMVIVPVDPEIQKAEQIGTEWHSNFAERFERTFVRHLKLEHHYRDDDGKDSVTKGLEACLGHGFCRTSKMSHDHGGHDSCSLRFRIPLLHFDFLSLARDMTDVVVGSVALLALFFF